MRFHNQELFIDIQSDDKAVPYFINTDGQVQWGFTESLGKS